MEHKPEVVRMDNLDGFDLVLQGPSTGPLVALKTKLDVFRGG